MNQSNPETPDNSTKKDIFVSYAHEDATAAHALISELEGKGWNVWWDDRLRSGVDFSDAIDRALQEAGAVVVLWSRASVASDYVKSEAQRGWDRGKLTPVLIEEEVDLPVPFNRTHATKLTEWPDTRDVEALDELFAAIAEKIATPSVRKRRRTEVWVPRLLAAVCLGLLLWIVRTAFLHYTPLVSVTSAALGAFVILAMAAFRRSPARFAADHFLRRTFVGQDGGLRAPAVAGGVVVTAGLVAGLLYVQPQFDIAFEDELDRTRTFHTNVERHGGGVVQPEWLLLTLDTRYNVLEDCILSIKLNPYGKVQFADLQSETVLGFTWEGLPPFDGVIDIPVVRFRGEAQVRVRWKHNEYEEVPEDAKLLATLKVGEWTDDDQLALSK